MATQSEAEAILAPLRLAVREQGELVRQLKSEGRPKLEVTQAVAELKARKKALEQREKQLAPPEASFNRGALEDLLKRRFFYAPAFSIYGGVAGLYDFGPMGCAMKSNLLSLWRQHFVLEENMLEVDCCILTPEQVLRASGHVERFTDWMVKDVVTGECFRADHLLEETLEKLLANPKLTAETAAEYRHVIRQIETYDKHKLAELLVKYDVRTPVMGNAVSPPMEFNLMFGTAIGPGGNLAGFMRPETAQGIFVNFKKLLDFNNGKLPFAGAQIGKAFRNEISPRAGLLRVREFEIAEIEHFVNPEKKEHPKFPRVADLQVTLYPACNQMEGKPAETLTLGEAVAKGIVANETLGYFLGRIHQFMVRVGVDPQRLRLRQHMGNEMAHYAKDCWDAECRTSYGWVECVGCADRSCFDLTQHANASKQDLTAKEDLPEPKLVDVVECVPDKGIIGKQFRKDSKLLLEWLGQLEEERAKQLERDFKENGKHEVTIADKVFSLLPDMVSVKRYQKTVHVVDVVPSVVEPSFGIGRIMYAVYEHNFRVREGDEKRTWLALPAPVAPISCSVLPLSNNEQFEPFVKRIADGLKRAGISSKVDQSAGTIGRRYARTDEIGIPFGITVDFDTLQSSSATLRERNSTRQIRAQIDELAELVVAMVKGHMTWADVETKYPLFTGQESTQ